VLDILKIDKNGIDFPISGPIFHKLRRSRISTKCI